MDLDHYLSFAGEFGARTVLDVGCGTGSFACLLAERGVHVVGVDPAEASLDVARGKPHAELVSDSTLRFRSRAEVHDSVAAAGFAVEDVRDAPDRPELELVLIARRPD